MLNDNHARSDFEQVGELARRIDLARTEAIANASVDLRKRGGRLFVLGVGGSVERKVSMNIVRTLEHSEAEGAANPERRLDVMGGYTAHVGNQVVIIPTVDDMLITPHTEAFQAVVWHCLVPHPKLQRQATKW
jgi:D-sedoheptulose 7-phosphate isomerase